MLMSVGFAMTLIHTRTQVCSLNLTVTLAFCSVPNSYFYQVQQPNARYIQRSCFDQINILYGVIF